MDGKQKSDADLDADKRSIHSVSYSPEGSWRTGVVAHSSKEDRVVVWTNDGKKKREFKCKMHVYAAGFAPNGHHIIAVTEIPTLVIRLPK